MNAYELNKFIGALLAALVFVMGLSVLSKIIFDEEAPEEAGYHIEIAADPGDGGEQEEEVPFAVLLASADTNAGSNVARMCTACHTFDEGGANGVGPGLYDIVGRETAGHEGFNYSTAMVAHADEAPTWDYAQLDGFLESPRDWVSGTIMGFNGVKDDQQRADLIAYLRSVSPDAPPLPEPPAIDEEVAADEEGIAAESEANEAAAASGTDTSATDTTAGSDTPGPAPTDSPSATEPASEEAAPAEEADDHAAAPAENTFASLVASSDPAAGQAKAAVCLACHAFEPGAAAMLGPNLHGIFGAPIAAVDGFNYSPAMKAYAADHGTWDIANLDSYLTAPMQAVPGTMMAFVGVSNEQDRAEIISWLHSISPDAGPIVRASAPATTDTAAAAANTPATNAASGAEPDTTGSAEVDTAAVSDTTATGEPAATPDETAVPEAAQQVAATPDEPAPGVTTVEVKPGVNIQEPVKGKVEVVGPSTAQ